MSSVIKGFIKGLAIALLSLAATPAPAQVSASSEVLSPAQQKIAWAQAEIGKNPKRYQSFSQLAIALARRARETSDVNYYAQAEAALDKSFALSPDNLAEFEATGQKELELTDNANRELIFTTWTMQTDRSRLSESPSSK